MRRFSVLFAIWFISIFGIMSYDSVDCYAFTSANVTVVAVGYITGAPGNFSVTYINDNTIGLSWIMPVNASEIMIRMDYGKFPVNMSDGFLVYIGNGTYCNSSVSLVEVNPYYTAWAKSNAGVWSSMVSTKEAIFMTQSAIFFGLIILAFCQTFFAFRSSAILFRFGAAISWLNVVLFLMNSSTVISFATPWCISLFFSVFCFVIAIMLMYMNREISQYGALIKKDKDRRSETQKRQDEYRDSLHRSVTHKHVKRQKRV